MDDLFEQLVEAFRKYSIVLQESDNARNNHYGEFYKNGSFYEKELERALENAKDKAQKLFDKYIREIVMDHVNNFPIGDRG